MAQFSSFFDSVAGDRIYSAADFTRSQRAKSRNGVVAFKGAELEVSQTAPASFAIEVDLGGCWVEGRYFEVYNQAEVIDLPEPPPTENRIDILVVRLDRDAREAYLHIIEGTDQQFPTPPAPVDDGIITDFKLAEISIDGGQSTITNDDIFPIAREEKISYSPSAFKIAIRSHAIAMIREDFFNIVEVPSGVITPLALLSDISKGAISVTTGQPEMVINEVGFYAINLNVSFNEEAANYPSGNRAIILRKAGSDVAISSNSGDVPTQINFSGLSLTYYDTITQSNINLEDNYFEAFAVQDSGVILEIEPTLSNLSATKVADRTTIFDEEID